MFSAARCSEPRETCELAGFGDQATIDSDLVEWNYGIYEGLTPKLIHEVAPDGLIFQKAPEQVGTRVDRVMTLSRAVAGDNGLFAHGHLLNVLAARWIGLPAGGGQHFCWIRAPCVSSVTSTRHLP